MDNLHKGDKDDDDDNDENDDNNNNNNNLEYDYQQSKKNVTLEVKGSRTN
jgi:hypothetical protein